MSGIGLEERVYRMRCVEAWSMVYPGWACRWAKCSSVSADVPGKPRGLSDGSSPERNAGSGGGCSAGVRRRPHDRRGDQPLTLLAVGVYGVTAAEPERRTVAPCVPWKYDSRASSPSSAPLQERRPPTSWNIAAPREYVSMPTSTRRWKPPLSQATERRTARVSSGLSRAESTGNVQRYGEQWRGCIPAWTSPQLLILQRQAPAGLR